MKTVRAGDANRQFSSILREVAQGEEVLVVARGRPVAKIVPVTKTSKTREAARTALLARIGCHAPDGKRNWTRTELYD
ncbi:MAG: type II toxin-antitoxin system prevent-host-death family antitoxin [Desulfobacteraceae bacterium]|nr:MAG: type II toxin-antitoxin system prevent-host-death family antitoxin [Desulfobacteraceae bacterium]